MSTLVPSARPRGLPRAGGLTLIEVLVVMAVVAILASVAVPSLATFQRGADVRAATSAFFTSVQVARVEAMKRGLNTYMVPAVDGQWSGGWVVFADVDGDQALNRSVDAVIVEAPAIAARVSVLPASTGVTQFIDGTNRYILFGGSGFPKTRSGGLRGGAIEFLVSGAPEVRRRVVLNLAGRARICDPARDVSADCRY
jgi:type IV fimbrial biogenesis protein FimT